MGATKHTLRSQCYPSTKTRQYTTTAERNGPSPRVQKVARINSQAEFNSTLKSDTHGGHVSAATEMKEDTVQHKSRLRDGSRLTTFTVAKTTFDKALYPHEKSREEIGDSGESDWAPPGKALVARG